jgi:hypothetical protein
MSAIAAHEGDSVDGRLFRVHPKNSALLDPELGTNDPTRDRLFSIQPLFNLSLASASRGQTSVVSKSANSSLLIATSVASNASLPTEVVDAGSSAIARRTVKSATLRI